MTLSHRWGNAHPFSLQKSNYSSLRESVHVGTLPRAFKDAIRICRRLQVWYIWIDSLCIVQDDHKDWLREAALMDQVYNHS